MKRILILHHEDALLQAYEDMLKTLGYEVFATNNHYKFLLYAGELSSDLLIFDTEDKIDADFIKAVKTQKKAQNIPLLLIMKKGSDLKLLPEITYLLFKPFKISELINILNRQEQEEQNLPENHFFYVENKQKAQDLPNILG